MYGFGSYEGLGQTVGNVFGLTPEEQAYARAHGIDYTDVMRIRGEMARSGGGMSARHAQAIGLLTGAQRSIDAAVALLRLPIPAAPAVPTPASVAAQQASIATAQARAQAAQQAAAPRVATATAAPVSRAAQYKYPGTAAQEAALEATLRGFGERRVFEMVRAASPWRLNPVVTESALREFWFALPYGNRLAIVSAAVAVPQQVTRAVGPAGQASLPSAVAPTAAAPRSGRSMVPQSIAPAMHGIGSYYETPET